MHHELKSWPSFFQRVWDDDKHFEVRKNDRGFQAGDTLQLSEYLPEEDSYSGRFITVQVNYVLTRDALASELRE